MYINLCMGFHRSLCYNSWRTWENSGTNPWWYSSSNLLHTSVLYSNTIPFIRIPFIFQCLRPSLAATVPPYWPFDLLCQCNLHFASHLLLCSEFLICLQLGVQRGTYQVQNGSTWHSTHILASLALWASTSKPTLAPGSKFSYFLSKCGKNRTQRIYSNA